MLDHQSAGRAGTRCSNGRPNVRKGREAERAIYSPVRSRTASTRALQRLVFLCEFDSAIPAGAISAPQWMVTPAGLALRAPLGAGAFRISTLVAARCSFVFVRARHFRCVGGMRTAIPHDMLPDLRRFVSELLMPADGDDSPRARPNVDDRRRAVAGVCELHG